MQLKNMKSSSLNHFNKYVNDYYFDDKTNYTWESILILHSSGDKRIALEKFFGIHWGLKKMYDMQIK